MTTTVQATTIHSLDTTVLLHPLTTTQLADWDWIATSDHPQGTLAHLIDTDQHTPVAGYEIRDTHGTLLGTILIRRNRTIHAEQYDPTTDDHYSLGDTTEPVLTQAIAQVLHARRLAGRTIPTGDHMAPVRPVYRRGVCPWGFCHDTDCPDHSPLWADHIQEKKEVIPAALAA